MSLEVAGMEESILATIRHMIGGVEVPPGAEGPFDMDLIIHINSILQVLNQLGVGREDFELQDADQTWQEFLGTKFRNLNMVKSYVYLRVKLLFDPPSSGTLMQAMKEQAAELEWRLNTKVDRAYREEEYEQLHKTKWNHKPHKRRHVLRCC